MVSKARRAAHNHDIRRPNSGEWSGNSSDASSPLCFRPEVTTAVCILNRWLIGRASIQTSWCGRSLPSSTWRWVFAFARNLVLQHLWLPSWQPLTRFRHCVQQVRFATELQMPWNIGGCHGLPWTHRVLPRVHHVRDQVTRESCPTFPNHLKYRWDVIRPLGWHWKADVESRGEICLFKISNTCSSGSASTKRSTPTTWLHLVYVSANFAGKWLFGGFFSEKTSHLSSLAALIAIFLAPPIRKARHNSSLLGCPRFLWTRMIANLTALSTFSGTCASSRCGSSCNSSSGMAVPIRSIATSSAGEVSNLLTASLSSPRITACPKHECANKTNSDVRSWVLSLVREHVCSGTFERQVSKAWPRTCTSVNYLQSKKERSEVSAQDVDSLKQPIHIHCVSTSKQGTDRSTSELCYKMNHKKRTKREQKLEANARHWSLIWRTAHLPCPQVKNLQSSSRTSISLGVPLCPSADHCQCPHTALKLTNFAMIASKVFCPDSWSSEQERLRHGPWNHSRQEQCSNENEMKTQHVLLEICQDVFRRPYYRSPTDDPRTKPVHSNQFYQHLSV